MRRSYAIARKDASGSNADPKPIARIEIKQTLHANQNYRETLTESVQSFAARLHRSNFAVVLGKLISELQACS
jgi:hypothetical protein